MSAMDRRLLLGSLGSALLALPARGQSIPSSEDDPTIQLLTNLFTRVGAAVIINGQGPFIFVIDTGAGATAISEGLAERLALPRREPVIVHGITAAARTGSVAVERLQLSGLNFRALHCPVLPSENIAADGLLGLDVLGNFRLSFDVQRRSASLGQPGVRILTDAAEMTTGSRLPRGAIRSTRGRFGQLILTQVTVEDLPTAAFVDSGAQYSIGNEHLRRAISARTSEGGRLSRTVPLYGVTGQSLAAEIGEVSDLRLGSTRLGSTPLLFADLHCFRTLQLADRPALLIGADLLGRFRHVVLDFDAGTVTFRGLRRGRSAGLQTALAAGS